VEATRSERLRRSHTARLRRARVAALACAERPPFARYFWLPPESVTEIRSRPYTYVYGPPSTTTGSAGSETSAARKNREVSAAALSLPFGELEERRRACGSP
jgi:hypothetical protein